MKQLLSLLLCAAVLNVFGDGCTNILTGGTCPAFSTNYFNLSGGVGAQPNTNLQPSAGFAMSGPTSHRVAVGLSGTVYGTASALGLGNLISMMTTNGATNGAITIRYAGSGDGIIWFSNMIAYTVTPTANTNYCPASFTNVNPGALWYFCIQQVENSTKANMTNATVQAITKDDF